MDKPYLLGRNATGNQLLPNIIIDIECAVILRGGQVAENKLSSLCVGVFLPDTVHIVDTGVDLAVWVIGQHRVNHSLVEGKFTPVIRDFEHIVDVRLDKPCPHFFSSLCKPCHHIGLDFTRLGLDIVIIDLWYGEL